MAEKTHLCRFDEEKHLYYYDDKVVPSVTQLLAKHGITPSYDNVNSARLAYKAERGTIIHEEIENFILNGENGMSAECQYFEKYIYPLCKDWLCEVRLFSEDYCGTCDLVGFTDNGEAWVIDTKTGVVHKEAVAWQTSMYARLMPEILAGKKVRFFCYDAKQDGGRLIELTPIKDEEIDKLLDAERTDAIYQPTQLAIKPDVEDALTVLESTISRLETQLKDLKATREEMYGKLKAEFEAQGVKELETAHMKITYVEPYERAGFDSKAFKADCPELYNKYYKGTKVSASLRVTLKEAKGES